MKYIRKDEHALGIPTPRLTVTTKPSFYPGSNMLGNIPESVRRDLIKGEVLISITETGMHDIPVVLVYPFP